MRSVITSPVHPAHPKSGSQAFCFPEPGHSAELLEYVLADLDMVLLYDGEPGFESQAFIPEVLPKIRRLREMIDQRKEA